MTGILVREISLGYLCAHVCIFIDNQMDLRSLECNLGMFFWTRVSDQTLQGVDIIVF